MIAVPLTLKAARLYVGQLHRHHRPPQGGLFAIGAESDGALVGCVIVGRPVAPALNDGFTAEVTRLTTDGSRNACSLLYGAAWRAAKAMGYRRMVTYIRADEPGTSLRASGWIATAEVRGGKWDHNAQKWLPSLYTPTTEIVERVRWEVSAVTGS